MRISDWSSDVCSSDLAGATVLVIVVVGRRGHRPGDVGIVDHARLKIWQPIPQGQGAARHVHLLSTSPTKSAATDRQPRRSEEHTSELQSLMRISYAVFCLKKKNNTKEPHTRHITTYT